MATTSGNLAENKGFAAVRMRPVVVDHDILSIEKADFCESFALVMEDLDKHLRKFQKDQDEDQVHDLRIALRRAQAHVRLLPKGVRKQDTTLKFSESRKEATRLCSRLRDLDVIVARTKGLLSTPRQNLLLADLRERRRALLKKAEKSARRLRDASLTEDLGEKVGRRQLERRFKSVVSELVEDINRSASFIFEDETNEGELHNLRVGCKKLRYTLEAAGNDKKRENVLKTLELWSDTLGEVHDWDVVRAYLRDRAPQSKDLIHAATQRRKQKYEGFRAASQLSMP
ncbi:MAG: CHAD domain-containing protein [Thaumarchaeota archaeon]|nr:CHAD domain-containing protein [Nitrososphaerota archaeon]